MTQALDGVRAKLWRARHHRDDFQQLLQQYLDGEPYSISVEFDPGSGWHDVIWNVRVDPPAEELALVMGECWRISEPPWTTSCGSS
jgi:hypothetical protein